MSQLNSLAPEFENRYERPMMGMGMNEPKMSKADYSAFCARLKNIENCRQREQDCQETCIEPCAVDPCCESSFSMGWLGALILWFIIFVVLFWLIFYSVRPSWAINLDGSVNTSKLLLSAIVAAIILIIIIWLIKACIDYSR